MSDTPLCNALDSNAPLGFDRWEWRKLAIKLESQLAESVNAHNVDSLAYQATVRDLREQLAEARKDRERYRWLRGNGAITARNADIPTRYMNYGIGLDAAIDAALSASRP